MSHDGPDVGEGGDVDPEPEPRPSHRAAGQQRESIGERKDELRRHYRALRRSVEDAASRSQRIWGRVAQSEVYRTADTVMVFDSIRGEPDTAPWKRQMESDGKEVWVPEDADIPDRVDLVLVPGVAFTPNGQRLGQGGGWYDRYLAGLTDQSTIIGVCFDVQVADELPTEAHDVIMEAVVTESRWMHPG